MSDLTHTDPFALRWQALLAENTAVQKEQLQLAATLSKPLSAKQMAQVEASSARLEQLSLQVRYLVHEWAVDARERQATSARPSPLRLRGRAGTGPSRPRQLPDTGTD